MAKKSSKGDKSKAAKPETAGGHDKVAKKVEKKAAKQAKAAKAAKAPRAPKAEKIKSHKPPKAAKVAKPAKAAKAEKKAGKGASKTEKKAKKAKSPIPKGLHTVVPSLVFKDSRKAIAFYKEAFGAKEQSVMMSPDGTGVWHAELRIGDSVIYLNDESPMTTAVAPSETHRPTAGMFLCVKNCDAWFERAVKAGATVLMPVADMFWGDRMGSVKDPFGIAWSMSTRVFDLSPKQMKKAGEEFVARMAAAAAVPSPTAPDAPSDKGE